MSATNNGNNYEDIQKNRLLKLQQQIVKHIIKKCDLIDPSGKKKEIKRNYFDSKEFKDAIQADLLIIKQNFKNMTVIYHTEIRSYEFSVFKAIIKATGMYTLKYRQTTGADKNKTITLYHLIPVKS